MPNPGPQKLPTGDGKRPPQPMTPERAEQLGHRWHWAGLGMLGASAVAMLLTDTSWPFLGLIVVVVTASESASCYGWRRGWLAREHAELKRLAGVVYNEPERSARPPQGQFIACELPVGASWCNRPIGHNGDCATERATHG